MWFYIGWLDGMIYKRGESSVKSGSGSEGRGVFWGFGGAKVLWTRGLEGLEGWRLGGLEVQRFRGLGGWRFGMRRLAC
jgi:hypothetical protein